MRVQSYYLWLLAFLLLAGCTTEEVPTPLGHLEKKAFNDQERPFKGEVVVTTVTRTPGPITVEVFAGEGKLTHLGKVTMENTQYIPAGPGGFYGDGEITAANGDLLQFEYAGDLTNLDFTTLAFTSESDYTITGGTGRFADAAGEGKVYGSGVFPQFPPVDPLTVTLRFDGWVAY